MNQMAGFEVLTKQNEKELLALAEDKNSFWLGNFTTDYTGWESDRIATVGRINNCAELIGISITDWPRKVEEYKFHHQWHDEEHIGEVFRRQQIQTTLGEWIVDCAWHSLPIETNPEAGETHGGIVIRATKLFLFDFTGSYWPNSDDNEEVDFELEFTLGVLPGRVDDTPGQFYKSSLL